MKANSKFILVVIAVIAIIVLIFYFKNGNNITQEDVDCITSKATLYVSKTCSHCANQKDILGDYLTQFNLIDCADERERCLNDGVLRVPSWKIDNELIIGIKTLQELKELTNC